MSNVERLARAGVELGPELDEQSRQRLESLSEDEMESLAALYTTESRPEVLWDNQGWADQTRSFLEV